MIRLVSGLLDRVPGDAVLHSGFEDIWLLRRSGDVSVSEQADPWPPPLGRTVPALPPRHPHLLRGVTRPLRILPQRRPTIPTDSPLISESGPRKLPT